MFSDLTQDVFELSHIKNWKLYAPNLIHLMREVDYHRTYNKVIYVNPNNSNQILEVNSIQWLSKEECFQKIRKYSKEKIQVVNNFFTFIYRFKTSPSTR